MEYVAKTICIINHFTSSMPAKQPSMLTYIHAHMYSHKDNKQRMISFIKKGALSLALDA